MAAFAPVVTDGMRPCTELKPWDWLTKYAGVLEEQPMPLILMMRRWSKPSSQAAVMMRWLMLSCPQPLHRVA